MAVKYIESHTLEHEPIYVGNKRHDQIFFNDIGFYFLSERPSPTFYHELYPGIATTLPVQQAIASDIDFHEVKWVVLTNFPLSNEPNASSISSDVHYLDEFIRKRFVQVKKFGFYEIWERTS